MGNPVGLTPLKPLLLSLIWMIGLSTATLSAQQSGTTNDQIWNLAVQAYQSHQIETGHIHLNNLIDKNPGDLDLALKCLEKILQEAGAKNADRKRLNPHLKFIDDGWTEHTARRLCALEKIGAISANSKTLRDAFEVLVEHDIHRGRVPEALDLIDRFVKKQPHDPFWRIAQARIHRRFNSSKTRSLFDELKKEMDLNHPNTAVRERWIAFSEEMKGDKQELPTAIQPLPKGSPLLLMEPDDPDGEWQVVKGGSVAKVFSTIDRLAAKALVADRALIWRDKSGLTDPARVLDLHLLSHPKEDLAPLRKLQAGRYAQEDTTAEYDALALYRRYAWAPGAHQGLLAHANQMLWAGLAQSALRSFGDLLDHSADEKLRAAAQVGYWAALAQTADLTSVDEMLADVDPHGVYPWLGKPTKARVIYEQLFANRAKASPTAIPALKDLVPHVVRTPGVSAWSSELPGGLDLAVVGQNLLVSGRDMLAMYNARETKQTIWHHLQQHRIGEQTRAKDQPGYFRPEFDGRTLYTRWGFGAVPSGIAALDHVTGQPLWSKEGPEYDRQRRRVFHVPMGDPVLSDGLLYYLQWTALDNVDHSQHRQLGIVCYDPKRRETAWETTINNVGNITGLAAHFERTSAHSAIYGNRVTIHQGAIYSNSNCGIVARSDVRDGRTDWVYSYRPSERLGVLSLGSPPVVAGNMVICMPRDAGRIFALDRSTGRLVWENPFVQGEQLVGMLGKLVIVRGQSNVVAIDVDSGDIRWHRPIDGPMLGRAQLVESSVYVADQEHLLRLDANTGQALESRSWALVDERPRSFKIHSHDLYIVTDKPDDPGTPGLQAGPLNPSMPKTPAPLTLPLKRAWSLPRDNAKITLPPKDSELHGTAYVYSSGILECIDVSAQGGIRWRRFIDAHEPSIQFAGKTLLVIDYASVRTQGVRDRVLAFDATSGRTLWAQDVAFPIQDTIPCGSKQIFHDSQGRIAALDLATGRQVWERDIGICRQLKLSWKADRLQVFFVSLSFTPRHLLLDTENGMTITDITVEPPLATDGGNNAKPIDDGYYEVKVKPASARYVRIVAVSEVNGAGWASMAELEVIGADGKNLSRKQWKVHKASLFETKHIYGRPELVFDGDRKSWWHSPWIGGIIPHPHEFQIDLGEEQPVTGIRVLPAVLVNNNGMIRDYELYFSKDGQNWGTPASKGILVNRMHANAAHFAGNAIYFEHNDRWTKTSRILRYSMDGKPAELVRENARIVFLHEQYYGVATRKDKEEVLFVHRRDDAAYQFELGFTKDIDASLIEITGDRLVMPRRNLLVADLAKKSILIDPSDKKQKHNQIGLVMRAGTDNLLTIVSANQKEHAIFLSDLRTGKQTEFPLANQYKPFHDPRHRSRQQSIQRFDEVLLLNDNSAITAWITRGDSKD